MLRFKPGNPAATSFLSEEGEFHPRLKALLDTQPVVLFTKDIVDELEVAYEADGVPDAQKQIALLQKQMRGILHDFAVQYVNKLIDVCLVQQTCAQGTAEINSLSEADEQYIARLAEQFVSSAIAHAGPGMEVDVSSCLLDIFHNFRPSFFVYCLAKHQPKLLNGLFLHPELSRPEADGLTPLILLLNNYPEKENGDETELMEMLSRVFRAFQMVHRTEEEVQSYLMSLYRYESAFTIARRRGFNKTFDYLTSKNPQWMLKTLLVEYYQAQREEADVSKYEITFDVVVKLLDAGLNPAEDIECAPGKFRSLLTHFEYLYAFGVSEYEAGSPVHEEVACVTGRVQLSTDLVKLIHYVQQAREMETGFYVDRRGVEHAGLQVKRERVNSKLEIFDERSREELLTQLVDENLLPSLLNVREAATQEQEERIAILFGCDNFFTYDMRKQYPVLEVAANLYACHFIPQEGKTIYARGCVESALSALKNFYICQTKKDKSGDDFSLSDQDWRWSKRLIKFALDRGLFDQYDPADMQFIDVDDEFSQTDSPLDRVFNQVSPEALADDVSGVFGGGRHGVDDRALSAHASTLEFEEGDEQPVLGHSSPGLIGFFAEVDGLVGEPASGAAPGPATVARVDGRP